MALQLFEQKVKMFPLRRFLQKYGISEPVVSLQSTTNVLLAQIKEIDRSIVEQLEMAGIYDTNDFENADPEIQAYLGLNDVKYNFIKLQVQNHLKSKINRPRLLLDLPSNYCLVGTASDNNHNVMAIIWRDMMFTLQNTDSEGWNHVKYQFEQLYTQMDKPELIGLYTNEKLPDWLDQISDYSVYIGGIQRTKPLAVVAEILGFPPLRPSVDAKRHAELEAIHLNYLFQVTILEPQ